MSAAARRLGLALAAAGLVLAGLVAGSLLAPGSSSPPVAVARARIAPRAAFSPGTSLVANVRGAAPLAVFRRPGDARPARRLAVRPGARVLLVRARRGAWLRVLLPVRPNGSGGWIRADRVALRTDSYRVDVALRAHRLVVRRGGRVVLRTPIGVGRTGTPTPRGLAYVTSLLRQPDPHGLYGPWAFGLSVYSPVLTSFGGGPGQVGIHGTDAPAGIGRDVSHGCIRLPNAAIERLARMLPLGTPVRIAA
jgi:lipoprotein-anchoring transpeptidase ErfK/SrfK